MKTVKAKLKGTDVTFEGSICDGYFYVSCDHNDFYRLNLDEIEICKGSLQVPETCKENQDSFTSLEEAARNYTDSKSWAKGNYLTPYIRESFIAGAEWQKEQMMKDAEEDALLLERAWLTLDGFGHEELAGRLRQFAERKGLIWK